MRKLSKDLRSQRTTSASRNCKDLPLNKWLIKDDQKRKSLKVFHCMCICNFTFYTQNKLIKTYLLLFSLLSSLVNRLTLNVPAIFFVVREIKNVFNFCTVHINMCYFFKCRHRVSGYFCLYNCSKAVREGSMTLILRDAFTGAPPFANGAVGEERANLPIS